MTRPKLGTAPAAEDFSGVECPVDRAVAITRLVPTYGTLPSYLSDLRKTALREALAAGHTATALAARVEVSLGRISQLTKPKAAKGAMS